ncbi:MAG: WD40 repeat domain-containing protein, partial [Elusimicrobia bacterium]|nr:WD40 repeat domain-containing protein [Elusimicrobiota bacterium]
GHGKFLALWTCPDDPKGKELQVLEGLEHEVDAVAFSGGGEQVAVADRETMRFWNTFSFAAKAGTGRSAGWQDKRLTFSPGGSFLLESNSEGATIWDPLMGRKLMSLPRAVLGGGAVALGPDRRIAVSGMVDVGAGKSQEATRIYQLGWLPVPTPLSAGWGGPKIGVFASGRPWFAAAFPSGALSVLDVDRGTAWELRPQAEGGPEIEGLAFSSDGDRLAAIESTFTVRLWDLSGSTASSTAKAFASPVRSIAFDGPELIVATSEPDGGAAMLGFDGKDWGRAPARAIRLGQPRGAFVTFRAEGLDLRRGKTALTLASDFKDLAGLSGDRTISAAADASGSRLAIHRWGKTDVWDLERKQRLCQVPGVLEAFSDDGSRLVVTHENRYRLYDGNDCRLVAMLEGAEFLDLVSLSAFKSAVGEGPRPRFSPDGAFLATIMRGAIRLWESESGKPLLDIPLPEVNSAEWIEFDPAGTMLAAGIDGMDRVLVWELERRLSSPAETAAWVAERVPLRLRDGRIVPADSKVP